MCNGEVREDIGIALKDTKGKRRGSGYVGIDVAKQIYVYGQAGSKDEDARTR
jgi:hypothetical protein